MIVTQDELFEIAREAAPRIDGAWRFHLLRSQAVRSWSPVAVITDDRQPGRGIRIRRSRRNEHRLSLAGSLPPLDGRPGFTKPITVDPQRGGPALAGDINRRLLPAYLQAWERRSQAAAQADAEREEFLQKLALMRAIRPDLRCRNGDPLRSRAFHWSDPEGAGGTIRMHPGFDRVGLELSLPFAQALRVLAVLKAR